MPESRYYSVPLLVTVLAALSSGTELIYKSVCLGDTINVLQNITFNSGIDEVILERDGLKKSHVAMWHMHNFTLHSNIEPEYKEKVFLDGCGSIWIRNMEPSDEAKYIIKQVIYNLVTTNEVYIYVLVAPGMLCMPKVMHKDNVLSATLDSKECGIPVSRVRWLGHPGISHSNKEVAKLRSGNEAGTYYACIEGLALTCLKNLTAFDICSAFTVEGSNSSTSRPEVQDMTLIIILLVAIIVIILVMPVTKAVWAIYWKKDVRKKNEDEEKLPLLKTSQIWTRHFGNMDSENMMKLLNDAQIQGLRKYFGEEDEPNTIHEDIKRGKNQGMRSDSKIRARGYLKDIYSQLNGE